ncbi:unnamed protein product [Ectocarpus sp. 4 AP-2014]
MAPTQHLSSFNFSFSSFLDEASCATRRNSLPLLIREHRPAEIRFKNMVRGGEFSDALRSLELNIDQVRESLCVLDFGLTAGGPRPYQDPRSHHWCMLRLRRLLGPGPLAGVGGAGGGSENEEEGAVNAELARLTVELMGAANAATLVPHLIHGLTGEEEGAGETPSAEEVRPAAAKLGAQVGGLKAYWPCLRELTLSCGIMRGDLEDLATCLGSLPALEVVVLAGHSYRAPQTTLVAFARALHESAASPAAPIRPRRLRTLSLKHFTVEGVEGVAALGEALSAERFPRLAALSINSCRLGDKQLCALAATVPGMSRTLKTLSFRSNYALSSVGVSALAEALRAPTAATDAGSATTATPTRPGFSPTTGCPPGCSASAGATTTDAGPPTAEKPLPERAPAWSVPSSSPPPPPSPSAVNCPRPTAAAAAASAAPARLMIESLDLSYSCWWNRPERAARTGSESSAEGGGGPFAGLLKILGEGVACPSLRSLRLEGCYLGDAAVGQLIVALLNESGSCRALRELNVNGNLFSKIGVGLFADAFFAGKMPPRLRMFVFCLNAEPSYRELRSDMAPEDMRETVELWSEHQNDLHISIHPRV